MATPVPILVTERNAAKLFDMKPAEFRALVEKGALQGAIDIHGHKRWRVADLEAIASGNILDEEFEI